MTASQKVFDSVFINVVVMAGPGQPLKYSPSDLGTQTDQNTGRSYAMTLEYRFHPTCAVRTCVRD